VTVNDRRVDIPSFEVAPGDLVSVREGSAAAPIARQATELVERVPPWLLADHDALAGRVVRRPRREEIQTPVDPQRIVELYSR
jgi:small subunit ribosomal protein S4